jgi:endoglucanase
MTAFLHTRNQRIVYRNKPVRLRGVNLGGWLMMEGYFMHSRNEAVQIFKKEFRKKLGPKALKEFEKKFRNSFVQQKDIKNISQMGFNCLRVPFHHRLIEHKPYRYDLKGVAYLDRVISWAKKYKLWVILDLHGACGSQNHDWHSDSLGEANLWKSPLAQKRTDALWTFLADRYKNNKTVAGYDLLNEAVLGNTHKLNTFYKKVIKTIRSVDQNHILFIEGNNWAMDLKCLDVFDDNNYVLSAHCYEPLDFTFNFVPQLKYPLKSKKGIWNRKNIEKIIKKHAAFARRHNVPVFVGEFGINARGGRYGEDKWLKDILQCFKKYDFHWTYWTYKAIKNPLFPDGLLSYRANPPWVNRQGPKIGWETWPGLWRKNKKAMARSWRSDQFTPNSSVLKVLRDEIKSHS